MDRTPFQTFIDLITFDQDLIEREDAIEKVEKEIATLQQEKKAQIILLDQADQKEHEARKEVDTKELEMKELDVQRKDRQARLDSVVKNKEYQAIKAEIDRLRHDQHNLEDELLAAWNALESAQTMSAKIRVDSNKRIADLEKKIATKERELAKLKLDLEIRAKQRPEKERNVPEEWLEKYAMMRRRVSDPVVPILGHDCSACFYTIPDQDLILIKRHKLLQCKGCYRFLYAKEPASEKKSEQKNV